MRQTLACFAAQRGKKKAVVAVGHLLLPIPTPINYHNAAFISSNSPAR